jgi:hypothetical protein
MGNEKPLLAYRKLYSLVILSLTLMGLFFARFNDMSWPALTEAGTGV